MTKRWIHSLVHAPASIAPLVTFRVVFGLVMAVSVLRFHLNGWIERQFIEPGFHFKYYGFEWVPELSEAGYYAVFLMMGVSALGIAFGALYRLSAATFFVAFTYIELVDASYYLNHYYFVSLVALLMVFLPAHRSFSIDVWVGRVRKQAHVPAVAINLVKFQLGLVYFLAGVAKLNADWLLEAMPLAIWLPAQSDLPIIGPALSYEATAYAFSWGGALYDLSIPFLLLFTRTRIAAFVAVVVFHMLTWWFFQIGMFPFIMIGSALVFFSAGWHERWQWALDERETLPLQRHSPSSVPRAAIAVVALFVVFQLLFPFRHLVYPGNPLWTEQGYRFGWRVMLMEKAGYAQFIVHDAEGNTIEVDNREFLTPVQEKMLSTQADFMLQFADMLKQHYRSQGIDAQAVTADVYVTMNGRASRQFIDPTVDLAALDDGWEHKSWILPLNPTKG